MWEDDIKTDPQETEREDWIGTGEGPMAGSCEHDNEILGEFFE
jgi:hypothetical protein